MRSTHSTRNLPLLTAKRQNNKPSGVAPFFGALAAIVILLLIGYQAFPPHIHASFADHDFPNGAQHMTTNISIPGGTLQGVAVTGMGLATAGGSGAQGARGPTLVAYMVGAAMGPSGPLPSELSNFQFFLAQGVQPYPSVSYLLLMHKTWAPVVSEQVSSLPPNVRLVWHEAACSGWGLLGWAIDNGHVTLEQSSAIVLVTPSMKGPFVPSYYEATGRHWTSIFTDKLDATVKLVAPMITCEPAVSLVTAPRHNPHPVPTMAAIETTTLRLLYERGNGLKCYQAPLEALYHGDAGVALQLLHAGFNMASLMARYKGVDWRITSTWNCNDGVSPMGSRSYDGIDMHPYESIFMPLEQRMLDVRFGAAIVADKLSTWLAHTPERRNISTNEFVKYENAYRDIQRAQLGQLDRRCFDINYYRNSNPDLQGYDDDFLWAQWLSHGQFEARRWLFVCNRLTAG